MLTSSWLQLLLLSFLPCLFMFCWSCSLVSEVKNYVSPHSALGAGPNQEALAAA